MLKRLSAFLFGLALVFTVNQSGAAPISVDIDKNVNLQLGTRNFGPVNVPDDLSICTIAFDRSNWTNVNARVNVELYFTVNGIPTPLDPNGTHLPWFSFTATGGSTMIPESKVTRALPAGINRQAEVVYVVSGARFRTTVTIRCQ
jgi:hypothetical protein